MTKAFNYYSFFGVLIAIRKYCNRQILIRKPEF